MTVNRIEILMHVYLGVEKEGYEMSLNLYRSHCYMFCLREK